MSDFLHCALQYSRIVIVFACLAMTSAVEAEDRSPSGRRITVHIPMTEMSLLDSFDVTVRYENHGAQPWILAEPNHSVHVSIQSIPAEEDPIPNHHGRAHFSLGHLDSSSYVLENGAKITEYSLPVQRELTIAPHQTHEFKVAITRGRTAEFTPGPRILSVKDDQEALQSNTLNHVIALTRSSVDRLLERVKDSSLEQSERNWPADWLEYIHPEPRLQLRFGEREDERRKKAVAAWPAKLRKWEEFWRKERDTPAMRKTLEEINGWNGVPVEVVRRLEERDDKKALERSDEGSADVGTPSAPSNVAASPAQEPTPDAVGVPQIIVQPGTSQSRDWAVFLGILTAIGLGAVLLRRRPARIS